MVTLGGANKISHRYAYTLLSARFQHHTNLHQYGLTAEVRCCKVFIDYLMNFFSVRVSQRHAGWLKPS